MWNPPTIKMLALIPRIGAQEDVKDPKVYMKFFLGGWTWYVTEFDGRDTFFGYVVSPMDSEWGYFSLNELKGISRGFLQVDRDMYEVTPRSPKKLSEVLR